MKTRTKALVLFSGGLDSRLVVKLLQEQGIEVECLYFKLPFGCGCCNDSQCNFNFSQTSGAKLTIIDCTEGSLMQEYLEIIRHPKFGRGSSMNPCIDCKIFMFKKAKEYADTHKFRIIATGEVLGERPMSQTSNAMKKIDAEIGFELLRPLSAKLLKETQAKRETLNAFFVASDGVVGFIESVESLGNRAGVAVEITGVSIEAFPTPRRGSELLRLSVRADGDFKSVFYFFMLLESLPAPLEFERVSLEGSEGAWSGIFSFSVVKKT